MSDEKNMTDAASSPKKGNKKVIILEVVLAIIAIICVGFGVYKFKFATPTSVDNIPLPTKDVIEAMNPMTQADCEAAVANGDMIKLENKDGSTAYVVNFKEPDRLKSLVSYDEADIDKLIYQQIGVNNVVDAPADKTVCEWYDVVDINFLGKVNGVAFEGGTADNQTAALGSGQYIPGFEDGIVGMSVGETKDINVTFPENYGSEELAGKDAVFTITLNKIISVPQELTDETIPESLKNEGITTVEGVRKYFADYVIENNIASKLNNTYFVSNINNRDIIAHYDSTMGYYENMSTYYEKSVEELVTENGQTFEAFKQEVINSSTKASLYSKAMRSIADDLGFTLEESEIQDLANVYECASIKDLYDKYGEQIIKDYLISQKVIEYLNNSVK